MGLSPICPYYYLSNHYIIEVNNLENTFTQCAQMVLSRDTGMSPLFLEGVEPDLANFHLQTAKLQPHVPNRRIMTLEWQLDGGDWSEVLGQKG